jgi:spore coat polysaccharide biosynthesis protein SpsF
LSKKISPLNKVAIVQARYGSTRLPGKILKDISGKPMLWHVVNRLSFSKLIDKTIIATTDLPNDNITEEFCIDNKIDYYRGSADDVLSRYCKAARQFNADIVIRITSDCPLIDPLIVDKMLGTFLTECSDCDYMSNVIERTFPRGLDTEIFTSNALEKAMNEAATPFEHEHVTPFIYNHTDMFKTRNYANKQDYSFHRWTVDTEEDLKLIDEIYKALYISDKLFLFEDVLKLFEQKPELININQHIKQKLF